jgi:hypothetical protein
LRAFELALHPDKTRLIRFGRHAAKQREMRGEGKPETFDSLGFTHFCTRSRKWGSFVIGRKTIKKRMRAKLKAIKMELRKRMHDPIATTGSWVKQVLQGHLNYYAVSGNHPRMWWFCNQVRGYWLSRSNDAARKRISPGSASSGSWIASSRQSWCYTRCLCTASTPEPEGGARCVSSARRDLCGGRGAILVPTATSGKRKISVARTGDNPTDCSSRTHRGHQANAPWCSSRRKSTKALSGGCI